jgi:hypothetical protein
MNMTESEAAVFLAEHAFIAIPAVKSHIEGQSKDFKKTIAVWAKALTRITFAEALDVLDRMVDGRVELHAYQFSMFPAHVASIAVELRGRDFGKHQAQEAMAIVGERSLFQRLSEGPSPLARALFDFFAEIKPRFDSGEISRSEALQLFRVRREEADAEMVKGQAWAG